MPQPCHNTPAAAPDHARAFRAIVMSEIMIADILVGVTVKRPHREYTRDYTAPSRLLRLSDTAPILDAGKVLYLPG